MRLMVLVMHDVNKLEPLISRFKDENISGTIINSTGMIQTLFGMNDEAIIGSLRQLLDMNREENRTILILLRESKIRHAVNIIEEIIGDLDTPNTGVVFTVPIDFMKGAYGLIED